METVQQLFIFRVWWSSSRRVRLKTSFYAAFSPKISLLLCLKEDLERSFLAQASYKTTVNKVKARNIALERVYITQDFSIEIYICPPPSKRIVSDVGEHRVQTVKKKKMYENKKQLRYSLKDQTLNDRLINELLFSVNQTTLKRTLTQKLLRYNIFVNYTQLIYLQIH